MGSNGPTNSSSSDGSETLRHSRRLAKPDGRSATTPVSRFIAKTCLEQCSPHGGRFRQQFSARRPAERVNVPCAPPALRSPVEAFLRSSRSRRQPRLGASHKDAAGAHGVPLLLDVAHTISADIPQTRLPGRRRARGNVAVLPVLTPHRSFYAARPAHLISTPSNRKFPLLRDSTDISLS